MEDISSSFEKLHLIRKGRCRFQTSTKKMAFSWQRPEKKCKSRSPIFQNKTSKCHRARSHGDTLDERTKNRISSTSVFPKCRITLTLSSTTGPDFLDQRYPETSQNSSLRETLLATHVTKSLGPRRKRTIRFIPYPLPDTRKLSTGTDSQKEYDRTLSKTRVTLKKFVDLEDNTFFPLQFKKPKSATETKASCSDEARLSLSPLSVEELSGYFDELLTLPKKMSFMAESMYA